MKRSSNEKEVGFDFDKTKISNPTSSLRKYRMTLNFFLPKWPPRKKLKETKKKRISLFFIFNWLQVNRARVRRRQSRFTLFLVDLLSRNRESCHVHSRSRDGKRVLVSDTSQRYFIEYRNDLNRYSERNTLSREIVKQRGLKETGQWKFSSRT